MQLIIKNGRQLKKLALAILLLSAAPALADDYFLYAGSYTDPPSTAQGIYAWRFSARYRHA